MALTTQQAIDARGRAVNAAKLAYNHRGSVHYTQGAARWEGINKQLRATNGRYPNYADCSSLATWAIWCGVSPLGVGDIVNGQNWKAGYTGTMLQHGQVVSARDAKPGDCVLYGRAGSTGAHTAICISGGPTPKVISHGSEAGPYLLVYNYRSDVMNIRRYIRDGGGGGGGGGAPAPAKPVVPGVPGKMPQLNYVFSIKQNQRVPAVKVWQERMKKIGHPKMVVDGVFGSQSDALCKDYQRGHKLPVDGVVGAKTWESCFS